MTDQFDEQALAIVFPHINGVRELLGQKAGELHQALVGDIGAALRAAREVEKIAVVDRAIASGSFKAGEVAEHNRILAVLERDPKLRFIASLIETSSPPFRVFAR